MLTIHKTTQDGVVTFELEGRLNSTSAPELEAAVNGSIAEAKAVVFDFTKLTYMSSAGLRILLTTQQAMEDTNCPDVTVKGANKGIKGVFAVTGFDNVLNVE